MKFHPEHEVLLNGVQSSYKPPTVIQLMNYAKQRGVDEQDARSAFWELVDNGYLELTSNRLVEIGTERR